MMPDAAPVHHPVRSGPALCLLLALALRVWDFGNPVIHVDEQYYLLVGDRLLHGAIPYIDIWDRKPIGLFLLFAAIRLLPGDGILAYQVVATLFAAATAWIIARSSERIGATRRGAIAAAAIYLLLLSLLGGRGGQSPVFYNLIVAGAAWLTLRLPDLAAAQRRTAIIASGVGVCLLAGVAIQMKYTPLFEGAMFGLIHLWSLRRAGASVPTISCALLCWTTCGLLPTIAAISWYAALGGDALHAWWFANIVSIGLRPGYPAEQIAMRLLGIALQISPLIAAAVLGWRWRDRTGPAVIAYAWLGAAVIGFLAIGTYFNHYALPLLPPLAVVAGRAFGRSSAVMLGALGIATTLFAIERLIHPSDAAGERAVVRIVKANSVGGCPYVFIGDTITYLLADTCIPTAYAFPNLLAYTTEQGATGVDEAGEVRRILHGRPPVILASTRRLDIWNQGSRAALMAALARDYRPVFSTPRENYRTVIYLRRDLRFRH